MRTAGKTGVGAGRRGGGSRVPLQEGAKLTRGQESGGRHADGDVGSWATGSREGPGR